MNFGKKTRGFDKNEGSSSDLMKFGQTRGVLTKTRDFDENEGSPSDWMKF
jgi:hypothetical protein